MFNQKSTKNKSTALFLAIVMVLSMVPSALMDIVMPQTAEAAFVSDYWSEGPYLQGPGTTNQQPIRNFYYDANTKTNNSIELHASGGLDDSAFANSRDAMLYSPYWFAWFAEDEKLPSGELIIDPVTKQLSAAYKAFYDDLGNADYDRDWFIQNSPSVAKITISNTVLSNYQSYYTVGSAKWNFLESKKLKTGVRYYAFVMRTGCKTLTDSSTGTVYSYKNSDFISEAGRLNAHHPLASSATPYNETGWFEMGPDPTATTAPTNTPTITPYQTQAPVQVGDILSIGATSVLVSGQGGSPAFQQMPTGELTQEENGFYFYVSTSSSKPSKTATHGAIGSTALPEQWNYANVYTLGYECKITGLQPNTKYYVWAYRREGMGYHSSDVSPTAEWFYTKPSGAEDSYSKSKQAIEIYSQSNTGTTMTMTIREAAGYTNGTKKYVFGYSTRGDGVEIVWAAGMPTTSTTASWNLGPGTYYMYAYEQGDATRNDSGLVVSQMVELLGAGATVTPAPSGPQNQSTPFFNGVDAQTLTSTSADLFAGGGNPTDVSSNPYWFYISTNETANPTAPSTLPAPSTTAYLNRWNKANVLTLGYQLYIEGLAPNTKYYVWIFREELPGIWNQSDVSARDWFTTKPTGGGGPWDPTRESQAIVFKSATVVNNATISVEVEEWTGFTNGTKQYKFALSTESDVSKVDFSNAATSNPVFNSGALVAGTYYVYAYEEGRAPQGGDRGFNDSPIIRTDALTVKSSQTLPTVAITKSSVTGTTATATASGGSPSASSTYYYYISTSSTTPLTTANKNELTSTTVFDRWNKGTTSRNFTGLSEGSKYYVWVYRMGNENVLDSQASASVWFTTPITGVDGWDPFKDIQKINISGSATTSKITANVAPVSGYNGNGLYHYAYSTNANATFAELSWSTPGVTATTKDFTVPSGDYYLYAYRESTGTYNRSPMERSGLVSTLPKDSQSAPNAVSVSSIAANSATATASGGASDAPNEFWFYISTSDVAPQNSDTHNTGSGTVLNQWNGGLSNTFGFTGLAASTTYYVWTYRVGNDKYHNSPVSARTSFTTPASSTGGGGSGGGGGGGGGSSQFTLQTIKNMAEKNQNIEIRLSDGNAFYRIPAKAFLVQETADELDPNCVLSQSPVTIKVTKASTSDLSRASSAAQNHGYAQRGDSYEFYITATYKGKTVEVKEFNTFVGHYIKISTGDEPVTTGVALNDNGTLRHVPTSFVTEDGVRYAKINSLTTGVFTLMFNSKVTSDMLGHWAETYVRSGLSRTYIRGRDSGWFDPTPSMTRAEFTAAIAQALGLKPMSGQGGFTDVAEADWYNTYVNAAKYYNVITGYGSTFEPNAQIKREEAMTILTRVCDLIGYDTNLSSTEAWNTIAGFTDASTVSDWARPTVAYAVKSRIVIGEWNMLKPQDHITRAEVIAVLERMLRNTTLISD